MSDNNKNKSSGSSSNSSYLDDITAVRSTIDPRFATDDDSSKVEKSEQKPSTSASTSTSTGRHGNDQQQQQQQQQQQPPPPRSAYFKYFYPDNDDNDDDGDDDGYDETPLSYPCVLFICGAPARRRCFHPYCHLHLQKQQQEKKEQQNNANSGFVQPAETRGSFAPGNPANQAAPGDASTESPRFAARNEPKIAAAAAAGAGTIKGDAAAAAAANSNTSKPAPPAPPEELSQEEIRMLNTWNRMVDRMEEQEQKKKKTDDGKKEEAKDEQPDEKQAKQTPKKTWQEQQEEIGKRDLPSHPNAYFRKCCPRHKAPELNKQAERLAQGEATLESFGKLVQFMSGHGLDEPSESSEPVRAKKVVSFGEGRPLDLEEEAMKRKKQMMLMEEVFQREKEKEEQQQQQQTRPTLKTSAQLPKRSILVAPMDRKVPVSSAVRRLLVDFSAGKRLVDPRFQQESPADKDKDKPKDEEKKGNDDEVFILKSASFSGNIDRQSAVEQWLEESRRWRRENAGSVSSSSNSSTSTFRTIVSRGGGGGDKDNDKDKGKDKDEEKEKEKEAEDLGMGRLKIGNAAAAAAASGSSAGEKNHFKQ
ncbi:hypothetical protein TYRP_002961 [Tyrophagus putrescentiae]|nr:hypothetical protein TYRP_002961 [Tyrophagus putrescentiae]